MYTSIFKIFVSCILLIACSACSLLNIFQQDRCNVKQSLFISSGLDPKHIAIMPFENSSGKDHIGVQVRSSFYNHFSSKPYVDIELFDVDTQIEKLENFFKKPWQKLSSRQIGSFMKADYIIYGEVVNFKKLFLGIYSQQALSLRIRLVDVNSGRTVWSENFVECSRECDLPLNPFSLIASFFRCGLELRSKETVALIDKACRNLVKSIPEPVGRLKPSNQFVLQLASFMSKPNAEKLMKRVRLKGLWPHLKIAAVEKKSWYRVVLGPYAVDEVERIKHMVKEDFKLTPIVISSHVNPT